MDDLRSLEDDVVDLVAHDRVGPTVGQLGDTVDASNVDAERGKEDAAAKDAKVTAAQESHDLGLDGGTCTSHPHHNEEQEGVEKGQSDDLEDDTRQHNVSTQIGHVVVVTARGDATTGGLEHQGDEVADDKEPWIDARGNGRVFGTHGANHVLEGQVDGSRIE